MSTPAIPGTNLDTAAADAAAEALLKSPSADFRVEVTPERESALDDAFKEASAPEAPAEPKKEEVVETPPAKPAAAEPPKPAPAPEATPAKKGLLDNLLPETPKPADPAAEAFEAVKLRSDASEKTKETFANLKNIAQQQIATARQEAQKIADEKAALEKQIEELRTQAGKPAPEVEAELKELREFRALRDVEGRPEFREKFTAKIEANEKEIYNLFRQEGMKEEAIAALQKMSPEARADYIESQVAPNLTAGQRRFVEAKLLDNVNVQAERTKALDAARSEADKIIAEQREAPVKEQEARITQMATHLKGFLNRLPFFHPKDIPTTATAEQKAEIEKSNALALELQDSLRTALIDDSPTTRAESALAVPLAKYYRLQHSQALARAEAAEAELEKIRKASATGRRLGQSASANPDAAVAPKPAENVDRDEALDALFKAATTS